MSRRWFAAAMLVAAMLFAGLGVWQVERLAWKRALIAEVDRRVHGAPVAARDLGLFDAKRDAYRHLSASGVFLHDRETLVQAVTELGPGYWVLTPLRSPAGSIIINRGFVPSEQRDPARRARGQIAGPVRVIGLLRLSEPGGGFLRANDPAADQWYSRDVAAIARAQHLGPVAPFFIDADATPNPGGYPVGGLTVIAFRNAHLAYALTWFALAASSLAGAIAVWRTSPRK